MENRRFVTVDGNEATANIAHLCNEVMAIYPDYPVVGLGRAARRLGRCRSENIFGTVPDVVEMQSEAGAAGAVHGALQAGALTTTFTASQGLLLMIPNMFKIAGELTATVFHVTARTVATHALSIFGDHGDVMACRRRAGPCSRPDSVQESQDMALIAHSATLEARVPFLHFFDGFRISHEVNKIEQLTEDDVRAMIDMDLVAAHRQRALTPERPQAARYGPEPGRLLPGPRGVQSVLRGLRRASCRSTWTSSPAARPAVSPVRLRRRPGCRAGDRDHGLGRRRGRGDRRQAGSAKDEKVGLLKVRLFRPWSGGLLAALPRR